MLALDTFGCERVESPFQQLNTRDTAYRYLQLSFAPIQNFVL